MSKLIGAPLNSLKQGFGANEASQYPSYRSSSTDGLPEDKNRTAWIERLKQDAIRNPLALNEDALGEN